MFLVIEDIKHDSCLFESCVFSHVKGACNTVAHMVARATRLDTRGCDELLICMWSFPPSITALADIYYYC